MIDTLTNKMTKTPLDAIVIGAGFSGLYQLHCLRDKLNLREQEKGGGDDSLDGLRHPDPKWLRTTSLTFYCYLDDDDSYWEGA